MISVNFYAQWILWFVEIVILLTIFNMPVFMCCVHKTLPSVIMVIRTMAYHGSLPTELHYWIKTTVICQNVNVSCWIRTNELHFDVCWLSQGYKDILPCCTHKHRAHTSFCQALLLLNTPNMVQKPIDQSEKENWKLFGGISIKLFCTNVYFE